MRRAAKPAVGLVALGGALTVAGMLLMGPAPTAQAGNPHAAHLADAGALLLSTALFWTGAGLLALGYAWAWRGPRRSSGRAAPRRAAADRRAVCDGVGLTC